MELEELKNFLLPLLEKYCKLNESWIFTLSLLAAVIFGILLLATRFKKKPGIPISIGVLLIGELVAFRTLEMVEPEYLMWSLRGCSLGIVLLSFLIVEYPERLSKLLDFNGYQALLFLVLIISGQIAILIHLFGEIIGYFGLITLMICVIYFLEDTEDGQFFFDANPNAWGMTKRLEIGSVILMVIYGIWEGLSLIFELTGPKDSLFSAISLIGKFNFSVIFILALIFLGNWRLLLYEIDDIKTESFKNSKFWLFPLIMISGLIFSCQITMQMFGTSVLLVIILLCLFPIIFYQKKNVSSYKDTYFYENDEARKLLVLLASFFTILGLFFTFLWLIFCCLFGYEFHPLSWLPEFGLQYLSFNTGLVIFDLFFLFVVNGSQGRNIIGNELIVVFKGITESSKIKLRPLHFCTFWPLVFWQIYGIGQILGTRKACLFFLFLMVFIRVFKEKGTTEASSIVYNNSYLKGLFVYWSVGLSYTFVVLSIWWILSCIFPIPFLFSFSLFLPLGEWIALMADKYINFNMSPSVFLVSQLFFIWHLRSLKTDVGPYKVVLLFHFIPILITPLVWNNSILMLINNLLYILFFMIQYIGTIKRGRSHGNMGLMTKGFSIITLGFTYFAFTDLGIFNTISLFFLYCLYLRIRNNQIAVEDIIISFFVTLLILGWAVVSLVSFGYIASPANILSSPFMVVVNTIQSLFAMLFQDKITVESENVLFYVGFLLFFFSKFKDLRQSMKEEHMDLSDTFKEFSAMGNKVFYMKFVFSLITIIGACVWKSIECFNIVIILLLLLAIAWIARYNVLEFMYDLSDDAKRVLYLGLLGAGVYIMTYSVDITEAVLIGIILGLILIMNRFPTLMFSSESKLPYLGMMLGLGHLIYLEYFSVEFSFICMNFAMLIWKLGEILNELYYLRSDDVNIRDFFSYTMPFAYFMSSLLILPLTCVYIKYGILFVNFLIFTPTLFWIILKPGRDEYFSQISAIRQLMKLGLIGTILSEIGLLVWFILAYFEVVINPLDLLPTYEYMISISLAKVLLYGLFFYLCSDNLHGFIIELEGLFDHSILKKLKSSIVRVILIGFAGIGEVIVFYKVFGIFNLCLIMIAMIMTWLFLKKSHDGCRCLLAVSRTSRTLVLMFHTLMFVVLMMSIMSKCGLDMIKDPLANLPTLPEMNVDVINVVDIINYVKTFTFIPTFLGILAFLTLFFSFPKIRKDLEILQETKLRMFSLSTLYLMILFNDLTLIFISIQFVGTTYCALILNTILIFYLFLSKRYKNKDPENFICLMRSSPVISVLTALGLFAIFLFGISYFVWTFIIMGDAYEMVETNALIVWEHIKVAQAFSEMYLNKYVAIKEGLILLFSAGLFLKPDLILLGILSYIIWSTGAVHGIIFGGSYILILSIIKNWRLVIQRIEEFYKKYFRNLIRIVYLFSLCALFSFLPVFFMNTFLIQKDYLLDASKPLNIKQDHCKLYINEDINLPQDQYQIKLQFQGDMKTTFPNEEEDFYLFEILNEIEFEEGCWVQLNLNPNTVINQISYECQQNCRIIHKAPSILKLQHNFVAQGENLFMAFQQIQANSIQVKVQHGELYFHNAFLKSDSSITTKEGDIVFQSTQDYIVEWKQDSNYVCLSAPATKLVTTTQGCSLNKQTIEDNLYSEDCRGSYQLCSYQECNTTDPIPTIKMSAHYGNIYANIIPQFMEPVSSENDIVKGTNYDFGFFFDYHLNKSIERHIPLLNDSSKADSLMFIELGNYKSMVSSSVRLMIATNPAYLDAKPWWIDFFSATLFVGQRFMLEGRLAPGFCPYYSFPTISQLGELTTLTKNRLGDNRQGFPNEVAYTYGSGYNQITDQISPSNGFRESPEDTVLYTFSLNKHGVYEMRETDLLNSSSLYYAVLTSMLLSGILGITGLTIFIMSLNNLFDYLLEESEHTEKYAKRTVQLTAEQPVKKLVKLESNLFKVVKRLPSQYALVDHFVFLFKRSFLTDSIDEFYNLIFQKTETPEPIDKVDFNEIKQKYEKYCFLKHYTECNLLAPENKVYLKKRGFKFEIDKVATFIRIGFNKDSEKTLPKGSDKRKSIDVFLETQCSTNLLPEDCISSSFFNSTYQKFCQDQRLASELINSQFMLEKYGIETINKEHNFLVNDKAFQPPEPEQLSEKQKKKKSKKIVGYNLNFKKLNDKIEEMLTANVDIDEGNLKKLKEDVEEDISESAFSLRSMFMDLVSVLFHLLFIVLMMSPLLGLASFGELEFGKYSLSDYEDCISADDFMLTPWNLIFKFEKLHPWSMMLIRIGCVYGAISLVHLFFYYIFIRFPLDTLKIFRMKRDGKSKMMFWENIFLVLEWTYIFLIVVLIIGYVGLVLVWSLLGAILNPTAYLAYAAAAGTFITYVQVKIKQLQDIQKGGRQVIQQIVLDKVKAITDDVMKKMLKKHGFSDEAISKASAIVQDPTNLQEKTIAFVNQTSIGAQLQKSGFNLELSVKMVQGDENAIIEFGMSKGVPRPVIGLLIAVVKRDLPSIQKWITELAKDPAINLPEELINVIIMIIFQRDQLNRDVLLRELSKGFFNFVEKKFAAKNKERQIMFQYYGMMFPQFIQSLKYLYGEEADLDKFVDELSEMNNSLIETVKKQCNFNMYLEESDEQNPYAALFKNGDPVFAIPSYVISGLELIKIIYYVKSSQTAKIRMERIQPVLYSICENVLGINKDFLDFFAIIYAESKEKIFSSSNSNSSLMQDQRKQILVKIGEKFQVPPVIVRLLFKVAFQDKMIDQEFIDDMSKLLTDFSGSNFFTPELLRLVFNFYALLQVPNDWKENIDEIAKSYQIESDVANVLGNISNPYEFSLKDVKYEGDDNILNIIKNRFRLKDEKEIEGLISILSGKLNSPSVFNLIDKMFFALTQNTEKNPAIPYVLSILTLLSQNHTLKIFQACDQLGIKNGIWILVGKNLIHPKYIPEKYFSFIGLDTSSHHYISGKDAMTKEELKTWKEEMIKYLQAGNEKMKHVLYLLTIENAPIDDPLLEVLIHNIPDYEVIFPGPIRATILEIMQLREIILQKQGSLKNPTGVLAKLFKFDRAEFKPLVQIIVGNDPIAVKEALHHFYKGKNTAHSIELFGGYLCEEITAIENLEETITDLRILLSMPKFLVTKIFTPFFKRRYKISLDDICLMFDLSGFTEENLKKDEVEVEYPTVDENKISFDRLRYEFATLALGDVSDLENKLKLFNCEVDKFLTQLFKTITTASDMNMMKFTHHELIPKLRGTSRFNGKPPELINLFMALILISEDLGNNHEFTFQSPNTNEKWTAEQYLSQITQVGKSYFRFTSNMINKERSTEKIVNSLADMLLLKNIPPDITKGIASIALGVDYGVKEIADLLKIDQNLMRLMLHMARFSRDKKIPFDSKIEELETSKAFDAICIKTETDPKTFIQLIRLSFLSRIDFQKFQVLLTELALAGEFKPEFTKFLYWVARSYIQMSNDSLMGYLKKRKDVIESLDESFKPIAPSLLKGINLDPQIATVAIRLRQGDYKILEDKKEILKPLMPTQDMINLGMGICGVLSWPVEYSYDLTKLKSKATGKKLMETISFEGAVQRLAASLGMNPIVARLVTFDKDLYSHVDRVYEKTYKEGNPKYMPQEMLYSMILTLASFPPKVLSFLLLRELRKKGKIVLEDLDERKTRWYKLDEERKEKEVKEKEKKERKKQKGETDSIIIEPDLVESDKASEEDEIRSLLQQEIGSQEASFIIGGDDYSNYNSENEYQKSEPDYSEKELEEEEEEDEFIEGEEISPEKKRKKKKKEEIKITTNPDLYWNNYYDKLPFNLKKYKLLNEDNEIIDADKEKNEMIMNADDEALEMILFNFFKWIVNTYKDVENVRNKQKSKRFFLPLNDLLKKTTFDNIIKKYFFSQEEEEIYETWEEYVNAKEQEEEEKKKKREEEKEKEKERENEKKKEEDEEEEVQNTHQVEEEKEKPKEEEKKDENKEIDDKDKKKPTINKKEQIEQEQKAIRLAKEKRLQEREDAKKAATEARLKKIQEEKEKNRKKVMENEDMVSYLKSNSKCINVWKQFKETLRALSKDSAFNDPDNIMLYERISLSHLIFFISLISVKKIVENPKFHKIEDYKVLLTQLDNLNDSIEALTYFTRPNIIQEFDRLKLAKLVNMTTNIRISNRADNYFGKSIYDQNNYKPILESYSSGEDIKKSIEDITTLINSGSFVDIKNFDEIKNEFEKMELFDTSKKGIINPYDKINIKEGESSEETEDFEEFKVEKLEGKSLISTSEAEIKFKNIFYVVPKRFWNSLQRKNLDFEEFEKQINFLIDIERFTVVDHEILDFLLGLAQNEVGQLEGEEKEKIFKELQLIDSSHFLKNYQYLYYLICLESSKTKEIENIHAKMDLQELIRLIKNINPGMVNDFLFLLHQNFNLENFKHIAQIDTDISPQQLKSLCLSAIDPFILRKAVIQSNLSAITPLLINDNLNEDILYAIVAVLAGRHLQRRGALNILGKAMSFGGLKEAGFPYMILNDIISFQQYDELIQHISYFVGNQLKLKKEAADIGGLLHSIMKKNMGRLLKQLKELNLASIDKEKSELFALLMQLNSPKDEKEAYKENANNAAKIFKMEIWKFLKFHNKLTEKRYREKIQNLSSAIFHTYYYQNNDTYLPEAAKINDKIKVVINLINTFSKIRRVPDVSTLTSILCSKESVGKNFLKSTIALIGLVIDMNKHFSERKNPEAKEKAEEEIQEEAESVLSHMEKYRKIAEDCYVAGEVLSKSVSMVSKMKDVTSAMDLKKVIEDTLQELPIDFFKNEKIKQFALLLIAFIMGDFRLVVKLLYDLLKSSLDEKQLTFVESLENIYEFITMTKEQFEEFLKSEEKGREYKDSVSKIAFVIKEGIKSAMEMKLPEGPDSSQLSMSLALPQEYQMTMPYDKSNKTNLEEVIQKHHILEHIFYLFHACKYGLMKENFMWTSIMEITEGIFELIDTDVLTKLMPLLRAILGISNADNESSGGLGDMLSDVGLIPMKMRMINIIDSGVNIYFPEYKRMVPLILKIVDMSFAIFDIMSKGSTNPKEVVEKLERTVGELGLLFGVNPTYISGLLNVFHGEYDALCKMVQPICSIDPQTIKNVVKLLKATKTQLSRVKEIEAPKKQTLNETKQNTFSAMLKKVNKGQATSRDLFELVDADDSGGISTDEFKIFMNRMGITLSDHRIIEIFSKIKRNKSKPNELDVREFEAAMNYVQTKRAEDALYELGLTTQQLIMFFILLTIILLLLFIFIFLGISAFSMGGPFGSIVNSFMPISAGAAVTNKKPEQVDSEKDKAKAEAVVDDATAKMTSQ